MDQRAAGRSGTLTGDGLRDGRTQSSCPTCAPVHRGKKNSMSFTISEPSSMFWGRVPCKVDEAG